MNRTQLDAAYTEVIRRHWRNLQDDGGRPSRALLDDLAAVATADGPAPQAASPAPPATTTPRRAATARTRRART